MANDSVDILFPVGRLIQGDCYTGSDKDSKGNPRLVKSGPNKGQQTTQFFLGVAIPKGTERAWWETTWGAQILAVGQAAFPTFFNNPAFAWKIEDGDSTVPNKSNRRPCDNEGAPGHWIVKFTSQFPPKIYVQPTPGTFTEAPPKSVKRGYWLQVSGNVAGNKSTESPGVFMNYGLVLFVKADTEITSGPDAATAFAGAAVSQALPGVAATPIPFAAGAPGMPGPTMNTPAMSPVPAAMGMPQAAAMPAQGAAMPMPGAAAAPVMVQANPGFLAVPGAAAPMPGAPGVGMPMAPPVPMAPAVPAEPPLTPAGVASGFTYAQYRSSGWSDAQLKASGLIA